MNMQWSIGILIVWLLPLIIGVPLAVVAASSKRFRAWILGKISLRDNASQTIADAPEPDAAPEDEPDDHLAEYYGPAQPADAKATRRA
jgi:hypothetical protein